ncbi:MFS transporter [Paenibacillus terrigena]|uniref:MFS transporter n=1 Tax=Paenibacillus terrigena TaxID=369333 RepID=UPI0003671EEE|nr:MFS transporter [Paenibacillus terrigena]
MTRSVKMTKILIFICAFIASLGVSIIMPVLSPIVRELHLTESQAGFMVTFGAIGTALMGPIWGRLSDRFGRKAIILVGLIGLCASYAIYTYQIQLGFSGTLSVTTIFVLISIGRFLVGAFIPAVPSASQAYMADITEVGDRSSGMAIISASSGMGLVFGPALGGLLVLIGLIWPMYAGTILPLIAFITVIFILPPSKVRMVKKPQRLMPWHRGVRKFLTLGLFALIAIVSIQVNTGFYFQDRLGLSVAATAKMLALALTLTGVAMLITQLILMRKRIFTPLQMIWIGALMTMIGFVILLVTESHWTYYLAFFIFGIGSGLQLPGYMTGASLAVSQEQQGAVAGLTQSVNGVSAIIAPVVSTLLYQVNHLLPFALCILLLCGSIWIALTPDSAHKSETVSPSA